MSIIFLLGPSFWREGERTSSADAPLKVRERIAEAWEKDEHTVLIMEKIPDVGGQVREYLRRHLASRGGRPTVTEWKVVRKTRYSKRTWKALENMAEKWSSGGASISPAQVAATIVEEAVRR